MFDGKTKLLQKMLMTQLVVFQQMLIPSDHWEKIQCEGILQS